MNGEEASAGVDAATAKRLAMAVVTALEADGLAYCLRIQRAPLWWFIRIRVHDELIRRLSTASTPETGQTGRTPARWVARLAVHLGRAVLGLVRLGVFLAFRTAHPVMFFSASNDYRVRTLTGSGSRAEDPLLGAVYARVERRRRVFVEKPTSLEHDWYSLCHRPEVVFWDWALALGAASTALGASSISGWDTLERGLTGSGVDLPVDPGLVLSIVREVAARAESKIRIQQAAAGLLLRVIRPSLVVETTSYDSSCVALNLEARRLGIPVLELQHGIVYRNHPGYTVQPAGLDRTDIPVPDRIMAYGDWYRQSLLASLPLLTPESVTAVGHPRFSRFLIALESRGPAEVRRVLRQHLGVPRDAFLITVTTQPIIAEGLACFLAEALKVMPEHYRLCLKIHPGEYGAGEEVYRHLLADPRVKLVSDQTCDLYELLVASDIHASVSSTVILEAMALGVANIVIDLPSSPVKMDEIVEVSPSLVAGSPSAFAEVVRRTESDDVFHEATISEGLQASRDFFCPGDAVSRILKEVNKAASRDAAGG